MKVRRVGASSSRGKVLSRGKQSERIERGRGVKGEGADARIRGNRAGVVDRYDGEKRT